MTPEPTPLVTVTQADRDAAAFLYGKAELEAGECRSGRWDDSEIVQAFARHRLAALQEAARYVEGAGGVIAGASVFAPLVSGNNMPCMSGDARDRLHPHKRREFDEATRNLATAIRALSNKGGRDGE